MPAAVRVGRADNTAQNVRPIRKTAAPGARRSAAARGRRPAEQLRFLRRPARPRCRARVPRLRGRPAMDPRQLQPVRRPVTAIDARGAGLWAMSARPAAVRCGRRTVSLPLSDRCGDQGVQVPAQAPLRAGARVAARECRGPAACRNRWHVARTPALAQAHSARIQPGAGALQATGGSAWGAHRQPGQPAPRHSVPVGPGCGGAPAKPARSVCCPRPNSSAAPVNCRRRHDHRCNLRTAGERASRSRRQPGERVGGRARRYAGLNA